MYFWNMPNQKISELTAIVTVDTSLDVLPIVDTSANTTKKISPTALKTALALDNVNNTSDANKPVSTAQQDALNAKVASNAAIVAATKTKITYDAKGLVTAGNVLDAADMPTGINAANIGTGVVSSTEFGYLDGVTSAIQTQLDAKQATLVSATNIKTINSTSLLGAGDISISASPSGVAGAIQFSNGSAFASDAANFFWDNTNKRLGVGTNAPVKKLNIVGGDVQIGNSLTSGNFNPATYRTFTIGSDFGSGALQIGNGTTGLMWGGLYANINNVSVYANSRDLTFETPVEAMRITSARNVGIGETTPTARLQVKGSGSTSATTSLLVQNSAGLASLQVTDDGSVFNYGKGSINTNNIFGRNAFQNNTTGVQNSSFGWESLFYNSTSGYNSAFGARALYTNTGVQNSAFGAYALYSTSSGAYNVAVGMSALELNSTGSSNSALGHSTSSGNFSGSVILGREATANGNNQFVVGSSTYNAGAIDSSAFTQDKRWKVKINGVDYYIALQTA